MSLVPEGKVDGFIEDVTRRFYDDKVSQGLVSCVFIRGSMGEWIVKIGSRDVAF